MSSTLITNARMVNEGRTFDGDLRIENGRIAQIGSGSRATASRWWTRPDAGCCPA